MSKSLLLMIAFVSTLLLLGCNKSETTTNRDAGTNKNDNAATAPAKPAATSSASTGEKVGVPECDQFLTSYEACISSKVPAASRAQFNAALEQYRKSWHTLASNPTTKPTLAKACKDTLA